MTVSAQLSSDVASLEDPCPYTRAAATGHISGLKTDEYTRAVIRLWIDAQVVQIDASTRQLRRQ